MDIVIGIVIIVNIIASITYAVIRILRRQSFGIAFLFLFLPVVGFGAYYIPILVQKMIGKQEYDRDSFIKRFMFEKAEKRPQIKDEMNVVPIGDAMVASENSEKRALLLQELKTDFKQNYRTLLPIRHDKDSESVHYVAAAIMERYKELQKEWASVWRNFCNDVDNIDSFHNVTSTLEELIESKLLSSKEQIIYRKRYCNIIVVQMEKNKNEITNNEYTFYLLCLIDSDRIEEALKFWETHKEYCKSERSYMGLLNLFYNKRMQTEFNACLKELREDDSIRLSSEGLMQIRL